MTETFYGYIETTQDVLLIFEGCRRGLLPRICRRLQEKERRMIRSGSVFVFDERESGIKRWTDGLVWSPSRILGNFLIYRELDKRIPGDKKLTSITNESRQRSFSADQTAGILGISTDRNRERRLVGSLSDSYRFRKDGLIKKTMSIIVNGVTQHLVSYYHPQDIISNKLRTPSSVPELASLEISPDLLVKQNFRVPPMVEPSSFDHSENAFINSSSYDERRAHSFRSMSLGSLHNTNSNSSNNMLGTPGNPSTPSLLYTPSLATNAAAGRMNMNSSNNKLPNNALPSSYYTNPLYSNTAGFSPLPSPSSITSSPMLSPVHQSFPHPRHYSISSASSGPIQRFAARNSFDLMSGIQADRQQQPSPSQQQQQQQHHPHPTSQQQQQQQQQQQPSTSQQQSIHPHMLPDMFLSGDTHIKAENDTSVNTGSEAVGISTPATGASGFSSSPNIGQLLNPIHPLNTTIKQNDPSMTNAQLFQSMNISSPSKYQDFSLPSTTTATPSGTPHFDSFSNNNNNNHYYEQQQQQQQQTVTDSDHHYHHHQEQQDTHSTNNLVPLFRNGMALPNTNSSSMYDESASDLGIEPLMLK